MADAPKKLADLWNDYATKVLPANAIPVQVIQLRRAFYAGAYATLTELVNQVGDEEDANFDMLGGFFQEAEEFFVSQIKGASA